MKTKYEYIHFVEVDKKSNASVASVYECLNNRTRESLGSIKWCPAWRQYCFYSSGLSVWSIGCLFDVTDFLSQLKNG